MAALSKIATISRRMHQINGDRGKERWREEETEGEGDGELTSLCPSFPLSLNPSFPRSLILSLFT
jgi:hypothetical protein